MLVHQNAHPVPPSRVFVLGSRGFLAGNLKHHFKAVGIEVHAAGSETLDLLDDSAGEKLAGQLRPDDALIVTSGLTPEKGRDLATFARNLRMVDHVAAALAIKPCAHLGYFSSDAVYDWRQSLVSESIAPSPTDLYSLMHIAREKMLSHICEAGRIPFCVIRPSAIYGAGDTHNGYGPNRFIRTAITERKIRLFGGGEETRDHIYIDDVVNLTDLIIRHRSTGVINAVSGRSVPFGILADMVAALSREPVEIESLPRSGAITHRTFDSTGMYRSFPKHRPTRLEEGLIATFQQMTANS